MSDHRPWEQRYSDATRARLRSKMLHVIAALTALGFEVSINLTVTIGAREVPVECIAQMGLPFWVRCAGKCP